MIYEYDFGDSWEHEVLLEKILPREPKVRYPVVTAGRRACPPEDVGGVGGTRIFSRCSATPRTRITKRWPSGLAMDLIPKPSPLARRTVTFTAGGRPHPNKAPDDLVRYVGFKARGSYAGQPWKELAETYLAAIEKGAKKAEVECDVVYERSDSPYEVIIRVAAQKGCDLIMMASHGRRGVKALLIGSETQKVLTHSRIPVLVYRNEPKW